MAERLVVVSNRLPLTARRTGGQWTSEGSSGGLVAAMRPVLQRTSGIWIGWPGDLAGSADDPARAELIRGWERDHRLVAVDLAPQVSRAFYEGYSNGTLWPLLHGFPSLVAFPIDSWRAYRDANQRFADVILARTEPGDLIWIHDYQLMLVPAMLRTARPDLTIGYFHHVPYPAPEIARILPQRELILRGLLGADLVAFQTHEHLGAFRDSLLQILGIDSRLDRVEVDGRPVSLQALPIGIEPDEWERLVASEGTRKRTAELRARHGDRRIILAVDRLDYTKGIPQRLRAYRRLLVEQPTWRGQVTLIQVAVPSREQVRGYAELRREVNELVGELNGELGTPDWTPVIYLRRSIGRSELAALYSAADVAWIGPLRDGMNLVAKEFVACQRDKAGVLVLSEFAGAARELGEAVRINPYDERGTAQAVARALSMPEDERHDREAALLDRVRRETACVWSDRFVDGLRAAAEERRTVVATVPPPDAEVLRARFRSADRRLIFVDYDGTLVAIADRPGKAVPTPEVTDALRRLAEVPETRLLLASGRTERDLERWFGDVPGLWLAAEHGVLLRDPATGTWQPLRPSPGTAWKASIRPLLEDFAARAPGSLIEEKELSLAWHYRLTEPEFGEWLANGLATALDQQVSGTELAVLRGKKIVEVRFAWANKGELALHVLAETPRPDFVLAIGDDRTDEDLFEHLPPDAWTIRVGRGATRARSRLPDSASVVQLLDRLATPG